MSVLIKNGRIVTAVDDYHADVFIKGSQVTLIGKDLVIDADKQIDASGKLVIPGGIDPHTHLELPFGGTTTSETFETGTRAAAYGGTTCIIDFAVQNTRQFDDQGAGFLARQGRGHRGRLCVSYDRDGHAAGPHRRDAQSRRQRRHQRQDVHGLPGRRSMADDGTIFVRCARRARTARLSACTPRTASSSTSWSRSRLRNTTSSRNIMR